MAQPGIPSAKLATRAKTQTLSRYGRCDCGDPLMPGLSRKGGKLTGLLCLKENRLFSPDHRGAPQGDAHATPSL